MSMLIYIVCLPIIYAFVCSRIEMESLGSSGNRLANPLTQMAYVQKRNHSEKLKKIGQKAPAKANASLRRCHTKSRLQEELFTPTRQQEGLTLGARWVLNLRKERVYRSVRRMVGHSFYFWKKNK